MREDLDEHKKTQGDILQEMLRLLISIRHSAIHSDDHKASFINTSC